MQVVNDIVKPNYLKIDNLVITGASNYSFLHEKTYSKSPKRAPGTGSINNLNSYSTFIAQHLKIDCNYMPIELYRELQKLLLSKNEFYVQAYDLVYNKVYEGKMYSYPEKMPVVYTRIQNGKPVVMGIKNMTIELVSTNNFESDFSIVYHSNTPNQDSTTEVSAQMNQEIILGENVDFIYSNKKLVKWSSNQDGSGTLYSNNDILTVTEDLVLYAIWQDSNDYYLSYSYNGGVEDDLPLNKVVKLGVAVGELPTTTRQGYAFGGWYQNLSGQGNEITSSTIYDIPSNIVIYAKWIPINYTIDFVLNGGQLLDKNLNPVSSITQGFETTIEIYNYTPKYQGKVFKGYFVDSKFEKPYSFTTMPFEGRVSSSGEGEDIVYSNKIYLKWE